MTGRDIRPLCGLLALASFIGGAACLAEPAPDRIGGSFKAWAHRRDAVAAVPGVLRYYVFEGMTDLSAPVPNLAIGEAPMRYRAEAAPAPEKPEAAELVTGRWPGHLAPRIDQGYFTASNPTISGHAFTAALWFRKLGQGAHRGNDRSTNGMIIAAGSGYYDGWRVYTRYPGRELAFEIGRPQGSVGISTEGVADGVWHHLAAVYDGRRYALYVDGALSAQGDFSGDLTPAADLRVGFAGCGIGSVKMDVAEVTIFDRALSPDEILQDLYFYAPLSSGHLALLRSAGISEQRPAGPAAEQATRELLADRSLNPDVMALAKLRMADLQRSAGKPLEAVQTIDGVLSRPALATRLSRQADEKLLAVLTESAGEAFPPALFARLLSRPGLAAAERLQLQLNLGHALVARKDFTGARAAYGRVVSDPAASPGWRDIGALCRARSFEAEGAISRARSAYTALLARAGLLPQRRDEINDHLRALDRIAKGLPAADPAAGRMAQPVWPKPGRVLHVAPGSGAGGGGTAASPLHTLEAARDAIRGLRATSGLPKGGVLVLVHGGEYRVQQTFTLTGADSGTAAAPIRYSAAPGEKPVFQAGAAVPRWSAATDADALARIPEAARAHMLEADLRAEGITDFGTFEPGGYASARGFKTHPQLQLYFNHAAMPLAGWPDRGMVNIAAIPAGSHGRFTYSEDRITKWASEPDAWVYGYWYFGWADSYEKIESIDPSTKQIQLARPYTQYGADDNSILAGQPFRGINLLSELDQPGEWYLDRRTGHLFFYPPSDPAKAVVQVSLTEQPVMTVTGAANVAFEHITWENGRGDAIKLTDCESVLFAGCTVRQFSGNGVEIAGGHRDGLLGCDLSMFGRGAIAIYAGDRKTLIPGGHFVENCHVHHMSLIDHTYTPAVLLTGAGNRLTHNLFHDGTSSAMRVEGNDHRIEYNDVRKMLTESDDQGASDTWANATFRGLTFRYNWWHDMGNGRQVGQAGIRLDDWISGVAIFGNIFERCAAGNFGGVQINQGTDNRIENNLFFDCQAAVSGGTGTPENWKRSLATLQAAYVKEIGGLEPVYRARYPDLAHFGDQSTNRVWRNIVLQCAAFQRGPSVVELIDNAVTNVNPGFASPSTDRFGLRPGSGLANRLSFTPIPFEAIGLYSDAYRAAK